MGLFVCKETLLSRAQGGRRTPLQKLDASAEEWRPQKQIRGLTNTDWIFGEGRLLGEGKSEAVI